MKKNVTILGAGSFGSAIAQIFSDKNYDVLLYTNIEEQKNEINNNKTNQQIFDDFQFNNKVSGTTDLKEAINFSDNIIIALPSQFVRPVLRDVEEVIETPKLFINVSKGIEPATNKMISEIIEEEISFEKRKQIVILSGPSHAEEIVKRQYTLLTAASYDEEAAIYVQNMFSNNYMRIYTTTDVIGTQIASTVKNVLAIASGIIYGMGYGDNTRAALITRGLSEMTKYGVIKGGEVQTFIGLSGIGDLIVTATSFHSRNFQTGMKIGKGMSASEAIESSKTVVEGIRATHAVYFDAKENGIEMPIVNGVYEVLFNNKKPKEIIDDLFARDLKPEAKNEKIKKLERRNIYE